MGIGWGARGWARRQCRAAQRRRRGHHLIGWMLGDVKYGGLFSCRRASPRWWAVDVAGALNIGLAGVIFSFMLVNLFDSSGTLIGVTDKAGLTDSRASSRA